MLSSGLDVENKHIKEKLKGIDFAMGVDQEGMSSNLYMQYA
jgi:hypothetical protein